MRIQVGTHAIQRGIERCEECAEMTVPQVKQWIQRRAHAARKRGEVVWENFGPNGERIRRYAHNGYAFAIADCGFVVTLHQCSTPTVKKPKHKRLRGRGGKSNRRNRR